MTMAMVGMAFLSFVSFAVKVDASTQEAKAVPEARNKPNPLSPKLLSS